MKLKRNPKKAPGGTVGRYRHWHFAPELSEKAPFPAFPAPQILGANTSDPLACRSWVHLGDGSRGVVTTGISEARDPTFFSAR